MNRRTVLGLFPSVAAIVVSMTCMVPAYAADAKSANGDIEVLNVWARSNGPADRTVYLEIINHGTTDDRLVGLSAPQAEKCFLEKSKWRGLNMTTARVDSVPVPAMSRTRLKPGGTYIHALGVDAPEDTAFPLTLSFANSGALDVTAEISVRKLGPTH
jgi:copper(I)-binding protein